MNSIKNDAINGNLIQYNFLKSLLAGNQDTVYGKKFSFSEISTSNTAIVDFRNSLPIIKYIDIENYIQSMMRGDQKVLTSAQPILFNLTSGTTSASKYIPVTKKSSILGKDLLNSWVASAYLDSPKFLDAYRLALPGSAIEGYTDSGIPFGSATGQGYKEAPWFISRKYAIPSHIFSIKNFDLKYFIILLFSLSKDISFVATPNPGTLIRLAEVGEENAQILIQSLFDGKLPTHFAKEIQFSQNFSNRQRARELDKILNSTERFLPRNYWNNIQLLATWLGGTAGIQANRLKDLYGTVPFRDLGYHASEGRMSLPIYNESADGLLAIRNNFFEFIPREDYENGKRDTKLMNELRKGEEYYVIVTNHNGLYRYDIEDIVKVSDFIGDTPIIQFCRKSRDMINISGEKIHINQILAAYKKIKDEYQYKEERFIVIPDYENLNYKIFIEMEGEISDAKIEILEDQLEFQLSIANYEYNVKRKSARLKKLIIIPIITGTIITQVTQSFRNGVRDVQYKWVFLLNEMPNWLKSVILRERDR